jgi:radial spoke head protein 4A
VRKRLSSSLRQLRYALNLKVVTPPL